MGKFLVAISLCHPVLLTQILHYMLHLCVKISSFDNEDCSTFIINYIHRFYNHINFLALRKGTVLLFFLLTLTMCSHLLDDILKVQTAII